jgi:dTDP-4-dehydrorhamnose reductase
MPTKRATTPTPAARPAVESPRPLRILLTGATGQVGWELHRSLRPLGEVFATARGATTETEGSGCRPLDLADVAGIRQVVRDVRPELIVNAAAYTAVDQAEREPELAWAVNAVAPAVLAEEARRLGAAVVHYSTDYIFAGTGARAWREDDAPAPLNEYGRGKLAGERALRTSGVPHLVIRTSWVYSHRGRNFPRTMLRLASQRPELRVVADQVGAPTCARVLADTTAAILAQAHGRLAERFAAARGTLHVCCAGETTWHGFAEAIFHHARRLAWPLAVQRVLPIATCDYPTPAHRPANSRLDLGRLREEFGLSPPHWETALAAALESFAPEAASAVAAAA